MKFILITTNMRIRTILSLNSSVNNKILVEQKNWDTYTYAHSNNIYYVYSVLNYHKEQI